MIPTIPTVNYPSLPAPPVIPTAEMAGNLVNQISGIIEKNSPEARAERQLKLATVRKQLASIPLQERLEADVFQHSQDRANYLTTEVYGPGGAHLEVKPMSPEFQNAEDPNTPSVAAAPTPGSVSGTGAVFGTNMDGSTDTTDEGKMSPFNAHHGAVGVDLRNPDLVGLAIGGQQAMSLTGLTDPDEAQNALMGKTVYVRNDDSGATHPVQIVDKAPLDQPHVEMTPAAHKAVGSGGGSPLTIFTSMPKGLALNDLSTIPPLIRRPGDEDATAPEAMPAEAMTERKTTTAPPDFLAPPPVPKGMRRERIGNEWYAIGSDGKRIKLQDKWQKVTRYDPTIGGYKEVWVDSSDPTRVYDPGAMAKPGTGSGSASQIENQIGRQMNTNPTLRAFKTSLTRYQQVGSNAAKPFDSRTSEDDVALIMAHAGIETPNQAVTNEQVKLAQQTGSWADKIEVWKSKFSDHPRVLSNRQVASFLQADHRAAEEARMVGSAEIKPYLERAEDVNAVSKVLGVDPRHPLKTVEAGSNKWENIGAVNDPGAKPTLHPTQAMTRHVGMVYTDNQGNRAKFMGGDPNDPRNYQPVP